MLNHQIYLHRSVLIKRNKTVINVYPMFKLTAGVLYDNYQLLSSEPVPCAGDYRNIIKSTSM